MKTCLQVGEKKQSRSLQPSVVRSVRVKKWKDKMKRKDE